MNWKKCLIVTLLICLITPMTFGQQEGLERLKELIASTIQPNRLYPGLAVREFSLGIVEAAYLAIMTTSEEIAEDAAAEAARPLLVEIDGLEAWKKGAQTRINQNNLVLFLSAAGAFGIGLLFGVLVE
ncbi:hypothetical protein LCGC14_1196830 [marine sediment metagenome]|uniref:Uncharacterized protein n=1 Tax=marine sediment metagenome TaxID=412755 RepID=A0A0F9LI58_9ZZZZ